MLVPLDAVLAEQRYANEPKDLASPDRIFERRWAMTVLEGVLLRLQAEQTEAGAVERFETLRNVLLGEPSAVGYAALAARFSVSESTVKSWVHRLRERYREILREEVAQTVSGPEDVNEELRHLIRVLS
jgi:DNA-directed RNA polymerase specialized sigma24 family protein